MTEHPEETKKHEITWASLWTRGLVLSPWLLLLESSHYNKMNLDLYRDQPWNMKIQGRKKEGREKSSARVCVCVCVCVCARVRAHTCTCEPELRESRLFFSLGFPLQFCLPFPFFSFLGSITFWDILWKTSGEVSSLTLAWVWRVRLPKLITQGGPQGVVWVSYWSHLWSWLKFILINCIFHTYVTCIRLTLL